MTVATLLRANLKAEPTRLVAMAAISGVASAGVLALVNTAAAQVEAGKPTTALFFMFLGAVFVFVVAQRYVLLTSVREVEHIVDAIRLRLFERAIVSDLPVLERVGRSAIFSAISKETQTISQTVNVLVMGAQSAILLVFSTIYLAVLSIPALIAGTSFTVLSMLVMFRKNRQILAGFMKSSAEEAELFGVLDATLTGFKETKMNSSRAAALLEDFRARSAAAVSTRVEARAHLADGATLSQALIFTLIGILVFIVPALVPDAAPSVVKTATAVLFMVGPLTALVNAVPTYNMANASAATIEEIEKALAGSAPSEPVASRPFSGFSRISVEGIRFRHSNGKPEDAFEVGPIDFEVTAGETIFVTGGNGSGKTTFIQLLIGLRRPMAGRICVDGRPVDEASLQNYRNLFAVVFSDCHLFRRLYGLGDPDPAFVDRWLDRLEIRDKIGIADGQFSTLNLSAGQRKRIALLVALLEDRPIVVLDEWAADQDPHFRRKFYRELLVELKRLGKTVIAITHDDRYFDAADRRIRMDYGKLASGDGGFGDAA
jgi:putative ATP-binding cassette transporter